MFAERRLTELDTYVAGLVEEALASARSKVERRALLQRASKITRQISKTALQTQLLVALERGEAPKTLVELQQLIEPRHARWMKAIGGMRRGSMPTTQRTGRPAEPMLTPGEVARELGVSAKTVTNWCNRGLLRCEVLESGHRRIPSSALDAYRASQAKWDQLDSLSRKARAGAPEPDEAAIFAEIAERRRG